MRTQARALYIEEIQKRLFWSLVFALVITLGLYVYFVNATVMNIVGRQTAEKEMGTINSTIADLESKYLALSDGITPDYARSLGFAEAVSETYATRKNLTFAYEYNGN